MSEVSYSTLRNWARLGVDEKPLDSRANKRRSKKRILPLEYFSDRGNVPFVRSLLALAKGITARRCVYSLGLNLLRKAGIDGKPHVKRVLAQYDIEPAEVLLELKLPENEKDFPGLFYQCLRLEGEKNRKGAYYTPFLAAKGMLPRLKAGETLLDPCCGSGIFLLAANAEPEALFGYDCDEVAVMAAKINLLLKYPDREFIPQIYCVDFLKTDIGRKFSAVATNPPWGADGGKGESFAKFLKKSYSLLEEGGKLRFLLPKSVMEVGIHSGLRQFVLENTRLDRITVYGDRFSGVTTGYVDFRITRGEPGRSVRISGVDGISRVPAEDFRTSPAYKFRLCTDPERALLKKLREKCTLSLEKSEWAIGIVTGCNSDVLSDVDKPGYEPVYTGREVMPYRLLPPKKYVRFNPHDFQQCAAESLFRGEKLIYRFVCGEPVFAYDESGALTLNSANILIPHVDGYAAKTLCLLLNSSLYRFWYRKISSDMKVLKSSLLELRFPALSEEERVLLESTAEEILAGENPEKADEIAFRLFALTDEEIGII